VIRGIDVASYQAKINWAEVKKAGCEFAIVKCTEANSYTNPKAADQVQGAVDVGLLVFLYHYARPNGPNWSQDAAQEGMRLDDIADSFERKLQKTFFCFLDVERNEPLSEAEKPLWRDWVSQFRRWCREEGERIIGWYSYSPFTAALNLPPDWEDTLLWQASYPLPFRPAGDYLTWPNAALPWARCDIHQDGGGGPGGNNAVWPGVEGPCDVNRFAGSRKELEELIASAR